MNETDRSESVRMVRDSVRAIVPAGGDLNRIRALRWDSRGVDGAVWQQVVDLGWLTLLLEEDRGGLGLGVRELAAIGEELGAALVPEPVTSVAAMVPLLEGSVRQSVLDGTLIVVPAWRETTSRLDAKPRTAVQDGRGNGTKVLVASAAVADAFVVSTEGGAVLVYRNADGVELDLKQTQDGGQSGTLTLTDATCTPLPTNANTSVCGRYPTKEPEKNRSGRMLDMPAARLISTLLPTGNSRINKVIEKGLRPINVSKRLARSPNRERNKPLPSQRA